MYLYSKLGYMEFVPIQINLIRGIKIDHNGLVTIQKEVPQTEGSFLHKTCDVLFALAN